MAKKKCPVCGCNVFYVKDPDDAYETFEFECKDGKICFTPDADEAQAPDVKNDTETFCTRCAWHDQFEKLSEEP